MESIKGDFKKIEHAQDKIIKHSFKTPFHTALNRTKRVGQAESSDMMNQISSSKTTHTSVIIEKSQRKRKRTKTE